MDPAFDGRMLRLFDTGNIEEGRLARDLRNISMEVYDKDPETRAQFSVSISPHFGGSLDGIASGFEESPKKWHVLEFKTHSQKSFDELSLHGVEASKPLHFAQMQIYMYEFSRRYPGEFDRAVYIAVNKNTDDIHAERVRLDVKFASAQIEKGLSVIASPVPSQRMCDAENSPDCLFCPYHHLCFGNAWEKGPTGKWLFAPKATGYRLEKNCRTCIHSTPLNEKRDDGCGAWSCAVGGPIGKCERKGCDRHLFVPDLLYGWTVVDAHSGGNFVKYSGGVNYAGGRLEGKDGK